MTIGRAVNYYGNNSWPVIMEIDLRDGEMLNFVSINKNNRTSVRDDEVDPIVPLIMDQESVIEVNITDMYRTFGAIYHDVRDPYDG